MAQAVFLARAFTLVCLFTASCSTPDVDPSGAQPASTAHQPTASSWVPRDNPELEPSTGPYVWKNVVMLGGGFVSGVAFGPSGTPYARTDVGGAFRWDDGANGTDDGHWVPLLDWAGRADSNLMGVESIAPDPSDPNTLYLAAGEYLKAGDGEVLSSNDRGASFTRHKLGVPMGGNADGRSMGERLAVDPNLPQSLYFGSRTLGLWHSADAAVSWTQVAAFPLRDASDPGLSLVLFDPQSGKPGQGSSTLYVGVATTSGPSLYRSSDAGESWAPVPGQPLGLMPHHAGLDANGMLYLSYASGLGPNQLTNGAVWKVDTATDQWTNVTPHAPDAASPFGYGGLALDAQHPGTVLVATLDYWRPDQIFRSVDGGATWREVGGGTRDVAGAEYLHWHQKSLISGGTGWVGSIALDPTNPKRAIYGTGEGLWWTDDVDATDESLAPHWTFRDFGLEETVPLALVSPPSGAPLLSGLGDIAGFRHTDLDAPPASGMFDHPIFGNTTSLDFAENEPMLVARVGTSSGGGGHGALSTDGGVSWRAFASEPSTKDGAGTIAVAADGSVLLWAIPPPTNPPATTFLAFHYSADHGATWHDCAGVPTGTSGLTVSDRVDAHVFYVLVGSSVYVSNDAAQTFSATGATVPGATSLRTVFGRAGEVWLVARDGLYHSLDSAHSFSKLTDVSGGVDVGFGQAQSAGYPALYFAGTVGGESGIFRSDDAGATFSRVDDDAHQFGYVSHVSGDPRSYGRVYLGTGGRGIIYGDLRSP